MLYIKIFKSYLTGQITQYIMISLRSYHVYLETDTKFYEVMCKISFKQLASLLAANVSIMLNNLHLVWHVRKPT